MHPLLPTFLRLTAIIAIVIVGLFLAVFILKIVLVAAVVAAVGLGGLFLYRLIRRRSGMPVGR